MSGKAWSGSLGAVAKLAAFGALALAVAACGKDASSASGGAFDPIGRFGAVEGYLYVTSVGSLPAPLNRFASLALPAAGTKRGDGQIDVFLVDPRNGNLMLVQTLQGGTPVGPVYFDGFLYSPNFYDASVNSDAADLLDGALTPVAGSPFVAGSFPARVAIGASGKFLYAPSYGAADIFAYSVSSGALTALGGSPFAFDGAAPGNAVTDAAGRYLYVLDAAEFGGVVAYSIDPTTGALTQIAGSPFAAGNFPTDLKIDPTGQFLYVSNGGDDTVSVYTIDPVTGFLTAQTGPLATVGSLPLRVFVVQVPGGAEYLYVPNGDDNTISGFSIDLTTGALTPTPRSPFRTGMFPFDLAVDSSNYYSSNLYLYVANSGGGGATNRGSVSAFKIDALSGYLTLISQAPYPAGVNANGIVFVPIAAG